MKNLFKNLFAFYVLFHGVDGKLYKVNQEEIEGVSVNSTNPDCPIAIYLRDGVHGLCVTESYDQIDKILTSSSTKR